MMVEICTLVELIGSLILNQIGQIVCLCAKQLNDLIYCLQDLWELNCRKFPLVLILI